MPLDRRLSLGSLAAPGEVGTALLSPGTEKLVEHIPLRVFFGGLLPKWSRRFMSSILCDGCRVDDKRRCARLMPKRLSTRMEFFQWVQSSLERELHRGIGIGTPSHIDVL